MAKITRVIAKIFGSGAGGDQRAVFGSLFAGSPAFSTDPAEIQSLSNWLEGWFSAAIGGNAPTIEDMNALCFVLSYQLAYLMQAGVPEWDTDTIYFIGSLVNVSGVLYVSLTDNNTGNAVTSVTNWRRYGSALTQYTADQTLSLAEEMVEFDATLAACTSNLPAANASGAKGKKFTITKTDASANSVKITDGTLTKYLLAQYDSVTVFSNGAIWYAI